MALLLCVTVSLAQSDNSNSNSRSRSRSRSRRSRSSSSSGSASGSDSGSGSASSSSTSKSKSKSKSKSESTSSPTSSAAWPGFGGDEGDSAEPAGTQREKVEYVKKEGQEDAKTCARGEKLVKTACAKMTPKGCPTAEQAQAASQLLSPSFIIRAQQLLAAGEKCNGNAAGTRDESTGECTCNTGNMGQACDLNDAQLQEKRETTKRKQESIRDNQKARDAEKGQCTDKAKRVYCEDADYVLQAKRETCVASKRDCVDPEKKVEYKAAATTRPPPPACDSGERRCKDGTCAADCAAAADPCTNDPDGPVSCGDGITCKKTKNECREEVKLNGCEEGMVLCPQAIVHQRCDQVRHSH